MNRGLTIVGRFDANTCPRCGHVAARDHRYCSVCGALLPSARAASVQRDVSISSEPREATYPESAPRHVGLYANRLAASADPSVIPRRPPTLSETVTIKTALLVAIVLSAATGAVVYLISTEQIPKPAATDTLSSEVRQESSEPDANATTGYLTEKTLHEIDVSARSPTREVRDALTSTGLPQTDGATNPAVDAVRDGPSPPACQQAGQSSGSASVTICQTNADVQREQRNSRKTIFSEITDPVTLERTIHEYGWSKTTPAP